MKNRKVRALSLVLACALVFTSVDTTVLAAENTEVVEAVAETEEAAVAEEASVVEETPVTEETPVAEETVAEPAEEEAVVEETEEASEEVLEDLAELEETVELNDATGVDFANGINLADAAVYYTNGSEQEYNTAEDYSSNLVVSAEYEGVRYALEAGKHFTVEFTKPAKRIGAAKVTVKAIEGSNITGEKTASFTVVPHTITTETIKLFNEDKTEFELKDFEYDGLAWSQTGFVVNDIRNKDAVVALVQGTDYTVSYQNNTKAGTATMVITGKGYYTGKVSYNFTINHRTIVADGVKVLGKLTYNGKAQKPKVKVSFKNRNGKEVVVPQNEYLCMYSNNVNAGSGYVSVVVLGPNYCNQNGGVGVVNAYFTISPADISKATISKTKYDIKYNSEEYNNGVSSVPVVKYNGKTLEANEDYKFVNDTEKTTVKISASGKIEGLGKVVGYLEGTGNYTGSKANAITVNFLQADIDATIDKDYFKGDGTTIFKPEVTINAPESDKFDVYYSNEKTAKNGKYYVEIKPAEGNKNYKGSKIIYYRIGSKDSIKDAQVSLEYSEVTYDGTDKKPAVTVELDGKKLTLNKDYKVAYKLNRNAGQAEVVVTGCGKTYDGVIKRSFKINPTTIEAATITYKNSDKDFNYTYNALGKAPVLSVKVGKKALVLNKDYQVVYKYQTTEENAASTVKSVGDVGIYTASVEGMGNYKGSSLATIKFTVVPKDLKNCSAKMTKSAFSFLDEVTMDGEFYTVKDGSVTLEEYTDYSTETEENAKNPRIITTVFKGRGNYTGTRSVSFRINGLAANVVSNNIERAAANVTQSISLNEAVLYQLKNMPVMSGYADTFVVKSVKGNYAASDVAISGKSLNVPAGFFGDVVIEASVDKSNFIGVYLICPKKTFTVKVKLQTPSVKVENNTTKVISLSATDAYAYVSRYEYRYSTKSSMAGAKNIVANAEGQFEIKGNNVGEHYYVQARAVVEKTTTNAKGVKTTKTYYSDWSKATGACVTK